MTGYQLRRVLGSALVAVLGVEVGSAAPDEPAPPAPGPRVRLIAPSVAGKRLVGTVVGLDEATLTLQREGAKGTLQVPRSAITTMDVSRQRSRKGRGAGIGLLVGVGAALAVGLAAGGDCQPPPPGSGLLDLSGRLSLNLCRGKGETAALSAVLTVPVGALLGWAVAPGEKWEVSTASRLKTTVVPTRDGVRAAITVGF